LVFRTPFRIPEQESQSIAQEPRDLEILQAGESHDEDFNDDDGPRFGGWRGDFVHSLRTSARLDHLRSAQGALGLPGDKGEQSWWQHAGAPGSRGPHATVSITGCAPVHEEEE
jgi:hypothetical protein